MHAWRATPGTAATAATVVTLLTTTVTTALLASTAALRSAAPVGQVFRASLPCRIPHSCCSGSVGSTCLCVSISIYLLYLAGYVHAQRNTGFETNKASPLG